MRDVIHLAGPTRWNWLGCMRPIAIDTTTGQYEIEFRLWPWVRFVVRSFGYPLADASDRVSERSGHRVRLR
jgi:hypothetical protein